MHAIIDQLLYLRRRFPERHRAEVPDDDLPFIPTTSGGVVEKPCMVETIRAAARHLRVQDAPDGSERITGHSLRPTGAQGLCRQGWSLWAIQLLGRWGSEVVRSYLRLAPLDSPLATDVAMLSAQLVTPTGPCSTPQASSVPAPSSSSSSSTSTAPLARAALSRE